jgi:hypothetical protein
MAVDFANAIVDNADSDTLLALLKAFLGIDPGDTTSDTELSRALDLAGITTETYLDRIIVKREVTEFFQAQFASIILHHTPVDLTAGVVVTADGAELSGYSGYLDRARLCHLSNTGERFDVPLDWRIYNDVTVAYTAGYDPVPADLAQALVYTSAGLYSSEGTGAEPGGASGAVKSMSLYDVGSMSFDVGSSSGSADGAYATGFITPTAANLLARYKRLYA